MRGTLPFTMLTLYVVATGGNEWKVYLIMPQPVGFAYACAICAYRFFFTFSVYNILTGIFVEKALQPFAAARAHKAADHTSAVGAAAAAKVCT